MNLLLLSTGRRVSLIQALRKAAATLEIPLHITGTEMNPDTASLQFCDNFHIVERTGTPEFNQTLNGILKKDKIDAILPGNDIDLEYLINHPLDFSGKILFPGESIKPFLRKSTSIEAFSEAGLKTPKVFQNDESVDVFPVIIKEDDGYGSVNQYIAGTKAALTEAIPLVKKPFIQEFIKGVEYTIDVFSEHDGSPVNLVIRERSRIRAGVSDVGITRDIPELEHIVFRASKHFHLAGPWNIQCIKQNDQFYFLEVNPRFSGGIPLTIAAGCNFCINLFEWFLEKPVTKFPDVKHNLKMMKYEQEIFI
jgi:carbamoyl-phosphate synthase large subunit